MARALRQGRPGRLELCIQKASYGEIKFCSSLISRPPPRAGTCEPAAMRTSSLPTLDLLATEPDTALAMLADHLESVHRDMHPADTLVVDLPTGRLSMGRHEVPGLAL